MNTNSLPLRKEVPQELKWKVDLIFKNNDAWEEEFSSLQKDYLEILNYKGKITESAETLLEGLSLYFKLSDRLEVLYVYAHLNNDTDTTDNYYQGLMSKIMGLFAEISSQTSFIKTELMAVEESLILSYLEELSDLQIYKHYFEELFLERKHTLSDKEEVLLAKSSEVFRNASETFSVLNNADLTFGTIKNEEGKDVEVSHGRYGLFLESPQRSVREAAFKAVYTKYKEFQNTFSTTLRGQVKLNNLIADVRHYQSARHAALSNNFIPETVYDALIEAVSENHHLLHNYVALRKEVLKLPDLKMYDLYVPMVANVDLKFTYQEAQEIIIDALSVLGEEYVSLLKKAFSEGWIDVVENKGKRSGAYSSGAYSTLPYILLNWQDNLDNVYTLAHELGHSIHSYYTRNNQPYIYGNYSIFLAEVASTTNENLLTDYFLKKYSDPKIKAYILNHYLDGFKGTVYRQTQFAEFEHLIHTLDQKGTPLTAEILSEEYDRLNRKYYGNLITYDEEIALEWARIPHFYYNYYVYQYATGFSAAAILSEKILKEGEPAITKYLDYLKAGCSDYPIEVLKKAGVDMTSNQPTKDALKTFEKRLSELKGLLNV